MGGRVARLTAGVLGATAVITVLTLLARVTGFARWFALNAWVGPNEVGTAYSTANVVPNVLFEVAAGGALAGAIIPLLAAPLARADRAQVDAIASALLGWTLAVLVPLGILTWLLADVVVGALLGPEAGPAQRTLAAQLLGMFALQVPLYGIGVVLSGVLQAHRRFIGPALAPLLSSLVVMASYYVFGRLTPAGVAPQDLSASAAVWLGWGTTAGVAALSLPLLIPLRRAGVRLHPTLRFPLGVGRRAGSLALAGAGGLLAQQLSVVVTVRLANAQGGADGVLNINQYATAVVMLPYAVLAVPLITSMFPRLAEHASTGRHDLLARASATSTRALTAVALGGAAVLVAAAPRIESVFGAFAREGAGVSGMAVAVIAAAPSVLGLGLLLQLSRVLFALERGRGVLLGTSLGWAAVAVIACILVLPGPGGAVRVLASLGLATSVGTLGGAAVLAALVRRAVGPAALRGLARTGLLALAGAVLGAGLGGGLSWWAQQAGATGTAADLLIGTLAGALALGVTTAVVIMGDREVLAAVRAGKGRG